MNGMSKTLLLLAGLASLSAGASSLREDEVDFVSDLQRAETDLEDGIDLRACWPVKTQSSEIDVAYSAVGWDFDPQPEGATVRLSLLEGAFFGGRFEPHPRSVVHNLATELTGKGEYGWRPNDVEKNVYRLQHETTRGGQVIEDETLYAYFDFASAESSAKFRGAVLGVSLPIVVTDDVRHPWSCIGGDGEGLRNSSGGETLVFAFTGGDAFAAELLVADGTVTVEVDGSAVAMVSAGSGWTKHVWPVAGYVEHTVRLVCSDSSDVRVRGCALTDNAVRDIGQDESTDVSVDLRTMFPVTSLDDSALKGLMYSAYCFERDAAEDALRTVTITARSGTLSNGVFTPDNNQEMEVLPEKTGEGTVDWNPKVVTKKVYRLMHAVKENGSIDSAGTLYGYFDFTDCAYAGALQADIESAVLGAITHPIVVTQDERWPWQPIDLAVARSGIVTDESLEPGEKTATAFAFNGRGVLRYDYRLTGGTLEVVADGEVVSTLNETTAEWMPSQVSFDDYGVHEVVLDYTAAGGAVMAIRNVRWEEQIGSSLASGESDDVRMDLQEGEVRTPRRFSQVLPFAYSPTNFIGSVDGTLSRVSIVQLAGDDPDVTKWTEEVAGTAKVLKKSSEEGSVKWRAQKGVWKASFEIYNGTELKETQVKFFDLRNASGTGMAVLVF